MTVKNVVRKRRKLWLREEKIFTNARTEGGKDAITNTMTTEKKCGTDNIKISVKGQESGKILAEKTVTVNVKCSHRWSDWKTTKEATYNSTGLQSRKCDYCNSTEEKVIPMLISQPNTENDDSEIMYGDVDLNGNVELADITRMAKYLLSPIVYPLGNDTSSEKIAKKQSDTNNDGNINAVDLSRLIEYNLGSMKTLNKS